MADPFTVCAAAVDVTADWSAVVPCGHATPCATHPWPTICEEWRLRRVALNVCPFD